MPMFQSYYFKEALLHLWPRNFLAEKRAKVKDNLRKISVKQRKSEMAEGNLSNRIDPWAFIRVKNEQTTLLASLNSILPIIKRGVIAYNDCTDGSDKIIEEFCKQNTEFIPFHYPFYVEPAGSRKYETNALKEENTLAGYYNAALEIIPKNEWIIKIDADQIYFPSILEHSFYLPRSTKDFVSFSRLNLIWDNDILRVDGYLRPGDHWLVYNDDIRFINVHGYLQKKNKQSFYSYELAQWKKRNPPFKPECSSVHFPFEKSYRKLNVNLSDLPTLDQFFAKVDKSEFSDELLQIKEIAKTFKK